MITKPFAGQLAEGFFTEIKFSVKNIQRDSVAGNI